MPEQSAVRCHGSAYVFILIFFIIILLPVPSLVLTGQTYPLDTRKTRAQSVLLGKTKEVGEASAAVAKSSMYKGLSIILIRTGVNNMILLSMFEYIKMRIDQLD